MTRASNAIGQHKTNRMHHRKKAAMATSLRNFESRGAHLPEVSAFRKRLRRGRLKSSIHAVFAQSETLCHRRRNLSIKPHVRIVDLRMQDASQSMNQCQGTTFGQWQPYGKREERIDGHGDVHAAQ